ncbi:MAG: SagB family peptide dehydrogenase [Steroidobacteraceae bacterium]|jgi:SagB-type dehydrogenase family enzyme
MKLKSASCQIAYWEGGRQGLRIANFLTRRTFATEPATLDLIRFFFIPRSIQDALVAFRSYSRESVAASILQLIDAELLLEYGSVEWQRDKLVESSWKPWLPEGAFHFMTKDTRFVGPDWTVEERLKLLPSTPPPPQCKTTAGGEVIRLPSHATERDTFFETLHARRTHRDFARGKVSLQNVSKLLHATWGVQGYFQTQVFGRLPYKTSPSGGARHPGEVYLMALRVDRLDRGIYHYQAEHHRLARLPGRATPRTASAYCADQPYVARAAALFIMTAVFARTMWKYGRARAYRAVLLETGHLCQTFCLTATRLGLAPFSTAALKDSLIEKDLGLDGISESVLYVAGVGLVEGRSKTRG